MRYIPPLLFGAFIGAWTVGMCLPHEKAYWAQFIAVACAFACVLVTLIMMFPKRRKPE